MRIPELRHLWLQRQRGLQLRRGGTIQRRFMRVRLMHGLHERQRLRLRPKRHDCRRLLRLRAALDACLRPATSILMPRRMLASASSRDAPCPVLATDVNANSNNGSCDFASCAGCTDMSACNYDSQAAINGYCQYPPANCDCNGNCLLDNCEALWCRGAPMPARATTIRSPTPDGDCDCEGCNPALTIPWLPATTSCGGARRRLRYSDQANDMAEEWCTNALSPPTSTRRRGAGGRRRPSCRRRHLRSTSSPMSCLE